MNDRSIEGVARLHVRCLPDSLITVLGAGYVRSFYRYVARSENEILVVERDGDGRTVAAAVLSLSPATLTRRLLLRTSLLVSMLRSLPRLLELFWASARGARRHTPSGRATHPERPRLILIFTAEAERGKGRGTALVREIERRLRQLGIRRYEAMTESDPSNPALDFYRSRGFDADGVSVRFGTCFQVFTRSLSDDHEVSSASDSRTPHST